MAKKYQKSQRQKGVFAYIFFKNKRKTVVRRAEVEILQKSQSASLALLVRSAAPTYAGFGVARRKFIVQLSFQKTNNKA